jgi:hypothetical protein
MTEHQGEPVRADKLEVPFELSEEHKTAIQRCLEKGDLRVVLKEVQVDTARGLAQHASRIYEWD